MLKIICPNCEKENTFQSGDDIPVECSYCFTSFPESVTTTETTGDDREIKSLTIIYQSNQQRLEIPISQKTVLGRENFGSSLFLGILKNGKPVVSRKHCSIEFVNGKFYLRDEDSLNGTFYGANKISCKNNPQVIEKNSTFFIGQEAFFAQINFKEPKQEEESDTTRHVSNESKSIRQYRCRGCGNNFDEFSDVCPECDRYNSLIPIYGQG